MKHAIVFYIASLLICFSLLKNKKVSLILSFVAYLLAVVDLLSKKLTDTHINFFVLTRMDLSMLEMAIEVVPKYVYGIMGLSIIIVIISFLMYRFFEFDIYNNKLIAVILIIVSLFGFYKSKTTKAYFELALQCGKIYEYSMMDADKALNNLSAVGKYYRTNEINAVSGKNIVMVYCESFENNLLEDCFSKETKNVRSLKQKGWCFYNNYQCVAGSGWTIGALYATQTGFPTYFGYNGNKIFQNIYASQVTSLASVLKKAGYNNLLLSNSKLKFGGTGNMMEKLGYRTVGAENFDKKIKRTGWGVHDYDLFELAKKEFVSLSKKNKPFNLTLLTVDTHFPKGVSDKRMEAVLGGIEEYGNHRFTIATLDYLLSDFIKFIEKQPTGKDTVIVIMSDHLMMGDEKTTKIVSDLKKSPRRNLLIVNKPIEGFYEDDNIGFYDIPNIVLDLAEVKHNANIGKKLIPHISNKFIVDNSELFQTVNLKLNK